MCRLATLGVKACARGLTVLDNANTQLNLAKNPLLQLCGEPGLGLRKENSIESDSTEALDRFRNCGELLRHGARCRMAHAHCIVLFHFVALFHGVFRH